MSNEPLRRKFWSNVLLGDGCWEWTGALTTRGYGKGFVAGLRSRFAHRIAYQLLVGEVPDALELDHLCRNHACVNPTHLEPVPHRENVDRGLLGTPLAACRRAGHPYTPENVREYGGRRFCRACDRERTVKRRAVA